MFKSLANVFINEDGATLVEYGMLVALVAAVCIGVVTTLGTNVKTVFTNIGTAI